MVEFHVGSFTLPGATGTQAITGVGFQPSALIVWASGSEQASGTWTGVGGVDEYRLQQTIGFSSGPTESYSVAGQSTDASTTSDTARRIAAKAFTMVRSNASVLFDADLSSFDADGFTLDWTTVFNNAAVRDEVMFLAIGGVDAKVVDWTGSATSGNQSVTGAGFTPDLVMHASAQRFSSVPSSTAQFLSSFGAMDAAGNQFVAMTKSRNGTATSVTQRYQSTTQTLGYLNDVSTSVQESASFVSMDTDGFTVNLSASTGGDGRYISLCLGGLDAKVGTFDTPGTTGTDATTGVGFPPAALLTSNVGLPSASFGSVQTQNVFGLGASDGNRDRSAGHVDEDAQGTTDAESVWYSTAALLVPGDTTGTVAELASLDSFDSDGWTLNYAMATGTDRVAYIALGAGNTAPNAPTVDAPADGSAQNVAASLTVDWTFDDPDAGDSQGGWYLRRVISGVTRYWSAATATWVSSETLNLDTATMVTLPANWAADGDSVALSVKTRDVGGLDGTYSSAVTVTGSTKVNPSISSPTDGATVNTATATVTWTVAEQSTYTARLLNAGGTQLETSGEVTSTSGRSHTFATVLSNGADYQVEVRTDDDAGLLSDADTHDFSTSFTPPATPTVQLSANDGAGYIRVAIGNPGTGTAETSNDVFRRQVGDTGDGIRVATGVTVGGTFDDYSAPSGVEHEYRVRAFASSNGTSAVSTWRA